VQRLIAVDEADDAEPRVAERHVPALGAPDGGVVRAAVTEGGEGALETFACNGRRVTQRRGRVVGRRRDRSAVAGSRRACLTRADGHRSRREEAAQANRRVLPHNRGGVRRRFWLTNGEIRGEFGDAPRQRTAPKRQCLQRGVQHRNDSRVTRRGIVDALVRPFASLAAFAVKLLPPRTPRTLTSSRVATMDAQEASKHVVDAAMKVHSALGPGLLEGAYEACLRHELKKRGLQASTQVPVPVVYDGIAIELGYRIDLLVESCLVVELKVVKSLMPIHSAQLLSYLKLSGHRLGLLINFHVPHLKQGIKRMINEPELQRSSRVAG
jgi:GxxExxY protein